MKINLIPSIIALALSALIAFGLYSWCHHTELNLLVSIMGGICFMLTIGTTLGISLSDSRATINLKALSGVSTLILLISNVVFCCLKSFAAPLYIIINGMLLLIWLLSVYNISKSTFS